MRYFLVLAALFFSLLKVVQAATLSVPDSIIIIKVNGEKVEKSFFQHLNNVNINIGSNEVLVQYEELFEEDDDSHFVVKSDPFFITFAASESADYTMLLPSFDSVDEAVAFSSSPKVTVKLTNKNKIVQSSSSRAQINKKTQKIAHAIVQHDVNNNTGEIVPDSYQMLGYWWSQATEAQRVQFLQDVRAEAGLKQN